jgi:phenylpyruvate tautomerase PptA (4-oxalocrotonate tautomerase family)
MDRTDEGLSRRSMLLTASAAAITATAAGGAAPALADDAGYGAPVVDLVVPAGALSREQKAAMIKGITDVLVQATGLPLDASHRLFVQVFETAEDGFGANGVVFVPRNKRPG